MNLTLIILIINTILIMVYLFINTIFYCNKGEYAIINDLYTAKCYDCESDKYMDLIHHRRKECLPQTKCDKGHYLSDASVNKQGKCLKCPEGTYMDLDNHSLTTCKKQPLCGKNQRLEKSESTLEKIECIDCSSGTKIDKTEHRDEVCVEDLTYNTLKQTGVSTQNTPSGILSQTTLSPETNNNEYDIILKYRYNNISSKYNFSQLKDYFIDKLSQIFEIEDKNINIRKSFGTLSSSSSLQSIDLQLSFYNLTNALQFHRIIKNDPNLIAVKGKQPIFRDVSGFVTDSEKLLFESFGEVNNNNNNNNSNLESQDFDQIVYIKNLENKD